MTADGVLVFVAGLVAGGALGYLHAWRLARKLEYFRVPLDRWQFEDIDQRRQSPLRVARDA